MSTAINVDREAKDHEKLTGRKMDALIKKLNFPEPTLGEIAAIIDKKFQLAFLKI